MWRAPPPTQRFNSIRPQPPQASGYHYHTLSQVPLLGAVGLAGAGDGVAGAVDGAAGAGDGAAGAGDGAAGAGDGAAGSFSLSQPTSPSPQFIGSMATQAAQGQGQGPQPRSFPAALLNWVVNQGAIPSDGAMEAESGFNAPGFAPGSGQATGSVSTSSLDPTTSGVSTGSNPSTNTASSWDGSTGPSQLPIIPIINGLPQ